MLIRKCEGCGMEKSSPTSPEDSFNCSTVTFEANGKERKLDVVYLRFFEKQMKDFTPFENDPLFTLADREITLKDVTALATMIQNPDFSSRKRVYLHEEMKFAALFQNLNFAKIKDVISALESEGSYELKSSIPFLQQPEI